MILLGMGYRNTQMPAEDQGKYRPNEDSRQKSTRIPHFRISATSLDLKSVTQFNGSCVVLSA